MTKTCTLCKIELPTSEFSIKKGRPGQKDILKSRCKKCVVNNYMEKYYNKPPKPIKDTVVEGLKQCIVCCMTFQYSEFHPGCRHPTKSWHYDSRCKNCSAKSNRERIKSSGYIRPSENAIEHKLIESKRKNVSGGFHKHGSKLLPFTIGVDDIRRILKPRCHVSGVELDMSNQNNPLSPSIDRVDNNRGYEPNNIRITSLLYNLMRNRWPDELILQSFNEAYLTDVSDCIKEIYAYNKMSKNYQFNLTKFEGVKTCQLTGLPLVNSRLHPLSPSFDRIDYNIGYTDGNIRLTALMVNVGRNKWPDNVFLPAFNKTKACMKIMANVVVANDFWHVKYDPAKRYLFADEFQNKFDIIFTQKPEVNLRPQKIEMKLINSPNDFYDKYHYIGSVAAKFHFGAFLGEKLIACMSIRRPVRQRSGDWEIARMASDPKYHVHGLWSYFIKRLPSFGISGKLISYSDKRLFSGIVYEKVGMTKESEVPPDYYWFMNGIRHHKSGLRKTEEEKLTNKTEKTFREAQGYKQVWDLGKIKWSMTI